MKAKRRLLFGIYGAVVVLVAAVIWGIYLHAVIGSVRNYKAMTYSVAKGYFDQYENEFTLLKIMMEEDFYPLREPWIELGQNINNNADNISSERKEKYNNTLSKLPIVSVCGSEEYIAFVIARWGFAGDTQGKAIVWYRDGRPVEVSKNTNITLGVEGWYYLHYR